MSVEQGLQVALFVEDLTADFVEGQEAAAAILLQRADAEFEALTDFLAGEINIPCERGAGRGSIALQLLQYALHELDKQLHLRAFFRNDCMFFHSSFSF